MDGLKVKKMKLNIFDCTFGGGVAEPSKVRIFKGRVVGPFYFANTLEEQPMSWGMCTNWA